MTRTVRFEKNVVVNVIKVIVTTYGIYRQLNILYVTTPYYTTTSLIIQQV